MRWAVSLPAAALLLAAGPAGSGALVPLAQGSGPAPPPPWHVAGLPLQTKPFTRFGLVELDGQRVPRVEADRSYGNLVHPLKGGAGTPLASWHTERRDLAADFLRLFGDEATEVPPLVGVGIGADADSTQTRSLSYIADLALEL